MNGDRFKNRLPKFLGKISDFEDLLIAEDKEFDRIDRDINRFDKGLFINTLNEMDNPDEFLKRLEKDYGLPSIGSYKERINAILVKKRAKEPTTPYRVEDLGNYYSDVDNIVKFISQYEEYSFIVEFLINRGKNDVQGFINALEEIKPAHLEFIMNMKAKFFHELYHGAVGIGREHITKYPYSLTEIDYKNNMHIGTLMAVTEYREMKGVD